VLKWSNDGRRIATGDADGFLSLFNVDKELANPRPEDFSKLERLTVHSQQQKNLIS